MKKLLQQTILLFGILFTANVLNAQSISIVTNPTIPDIFEWTSGGALSGYCGKPMEFNNTLVLQYNAASESDITEAPIQFAVYNGGDSLHLIPNPGAGTGVYFQGPQLVFNNKLFFIYIDSTQAQKLASFDGTSITVYPNPDASTSGFIGSPRIYNNQLYGVYINAAGVTQFGVFNGSGLTLIPNPDNSPTGFRYDYSVIFDNKICANYQNANNVGQLATYDGTSWTLFPNPDNSAYGIQGVFPVNYNNKLYWDYFSSTNQFQLMQFDGTDAPTLIANPEDESANNGGYAGLPIVNDDTLFIQYYNAENVLQLAKFGGTALTLVPNPDATTYGYWNTPVVYNNQLYIFYLPVDGTHHIALYQSDSNNLKVYPNPDGGLGYWDQPIVYDNNIFFMYYNAQSVFQLGYFDGTAINLITNPGGIYNGASGNNGYTGFPIIWDSLLYMQFGSVPYGDAGNLAYFDGSSLPVTLLNFTAQKSGTASLLQWKVANEVNNAYFSVERSTDGANFQAIGNVTGHGTVSTQQHYQFVDEAPFKGMNYYRLKQVDLNGKYTYSNIATVLFESSAAFGVFPNPAVSTVNISLPLTTVSSVIDVYDLSGNKVMEEEIGSNTSSSTMDVSGLAAGVYQVKLVQGGQEQTVRFVKQ
jgi:hypothetical protein